MHKELLNRILSTQVRKAATLCLTAGICISSLNVVVAAPETKTQAQQQQRGQTKQFDLSKLSARDREDIILVMPNSSAEKDELADVLQENNGIVIGQMGSGDLTVLLVKVQRGQAAKVEKKLRADKKHFNTVNANRQETATAYTPKDPGYKSPGAWHFNRLNLPDAWEFLNNNRHPVMQGLFVFDTGCDGKDINRVSQGTNAISAKGLASKLKTKLICDDVEGQEENIMRWGNTIRTLTYSLTDQHGHGTAVSSAIAGTPNEEQSIGVNPYVQIIPIQIADGPYGDPNTKTDDLAVVAGMMCAFDAANAPVNNCRIINISYKNMWNDDKHPVLHKLMEHWYYKKDGLVFVSAGNDGEYLDDTDRPYVNVISALGDVKEMKLANVPGKDPWASNWGPPVDFTAPGQNIPVADPRGMFVWADGTSLSSPLVAGIASLCLSVNPKLHNYQVESILRRSCVNTGRGRNPKFGYGRPDAFKAIQMAKAAK